MKVRPGLSRYREERHQGPERSCGSRNRLADLRPSNNLTFNTIRTRPPLYYPCIPASIICPIHFQISFIEAAGNYHERRSRHFPTPSENGCMFGAACELPPDSLPTNVFALVQAARDFGTHGAW